MLRRLMTRVLPAAAAVILFTAAPARALVDAAVTGGYTFAGDAEIIDDRYDGVRGQSLGVLVHLNYRGSLFTPGFGICWQKGRFDYDINGAKQYFILKSSWGPDFILMLTASSRTHPYLRMGFSIADDLEYDYGAEYKDKRRFFNSAWAAAGISFNVMENLNLLTEYQFCKTSLNSDHQVDRHSAQLGLMFIY